jgi:outer membrane lipopolysaccharide assembly protein LptE/RlpB
MMPKMLLFLLMLWLSLLSAAVIVVDADGFGQYAAIQDGINASVNGDTILVYPGTYVENVDFAGKSITLAGLELTTGNPAYRDSTIIDGNQTGPCVKAMNTPITCTIFGFTIRNGSGTPHGDFILGGGILAYNITQITVSNCTITGNTAYWGGGICSYRGLLVLRACQIYNNIAGVGGGTHFSGPSTAVFDSVQRCSVYENYSQCGSDIHAMDTGSVINIYLDMATLSYPDEYYQMYIKSSPSAIGSFTFDILQGYREEVNHDLYVSPDGDDSNTGFSPNEPLKTIAWALHKIAPDSLNPKTVHVLPGTYSTQDGQIFPLYLKNHTRLIGNETEHPYLDNDMRYGIMSTFRKRNVVIKNFKVNSINTLQEGIFTLSNTQTLEFSNIEVLQASMSSSICNFGLTDNLTMQDVEINNITTLKGYGFNGQVYNAVFNHIKVNNFHSTDQNSSARILFNAHVRESLQMSNVSITNSSIDGQAMIIQVQNWEYLSPQINISNLLIANNTTNYIVSSLFKNQYVFGNLNNCTFANNTASGHAVELIGKWNVSNCIFANHNQTEIYVPNTIAYTAQVNFRNNLIEDYPGSVYAPNPATVNFLEGNFAGDPGFVGTDWSNPLSYRLGNDSPCIDAGTPDTTGLYLPEVDLLGNPRIYNGIIDIGCYEWNGTGIDEEILVITDGIKLSLYPNPVYANVSKGSYSFIEFTLPKKAKEPPEVEIYNLKGQKVRSLTISQSYNDLVRKAGLSKEVNTGGEFYSTVFDCKDMNSRPLATGIYLIRVKADGRQKTAKLTILR